MTPRGSTPSQPRLRGATGWWTWWILFLAIAGVAGAGDEPARTEESGASLTVDGAGWLRDRELRLALNRLLSTELDTHLTANAIEDAAVILVSALGEEGFQEPEVVIEATRTDGTLLRQVFDPTFTRTLPRRLAARAVHFQLTPGVRWHVADVAFAGLTAIPEKQARAFFRSDATLLATARTNAFSPAKVNRGVDALLGELRQRGYIAAEVKGAASAPDAEGRVTVRVDVREGERWEVVGLWYQRGEDDAVELPQPAAWVGRAWSPTVQEDIREAIRQAYYAEGYPDVGVHVEAEAVERAAGVVRAEVIATIVPGPRVTVGEVRFRGRTVTKPSVLRRRVRLNPGDHLDPVSLERARYRLARLGVFESVDLRYEPADGAVRDPVFTVREGPRYETHLLFGYGSYEQVRAGVEHRQRNIFGLAHQSRLELVQSLKSTSANYAYTVPELFGESLDGTARLYGLQREEIAFTRREYGLDVSLRRRVPLIRGDARAGYVFESLLTRANELSTKEVDETDLIVASLNFGLFSDTRDNPLRPRHGYHWSMQVEAADPGFGGEATYQRLEVASAYHTRWGEGRWVHVGLSQGIITTLGSTDATLPVNKRFFPGGDNSVRGYQRGEAAPRSPDGRFLGAKAYLLLNLELEQALTPTWSAVAFVDALGSAVSLRDFPFAEELYSAGLAIRYQTLIGPIRLEYGRNLNPRPADPSGTWHLSIGYPF